MLPSCKVYTGYIGGCAANAYYKSQCHKYRQGNGNLDYQEWARYINKQEWVGKLGWSLIPSNGTKKRDKNRNGLLKTAYY